MLISVMSDQRKLILLVSSHIRLPLFLIMMSGFLMLACSHFSVQAFYAASSFCVLIWSVCQEVSVLVSHALFFSFLKKKNIFTSLNYFHLRANNDITAQTSTFLNRIFIKNKVRKEVWQVLEVVLI